MMRDSRGDLAYWNEQVQSTLSCVEGMWSRSARPAGDPSYAPQYLFVLAREYLQLMLCRYSRGDAVGDLCQDFSPLLRAWEDAERLGRDVWTAEQQYTRHTWAVNFDHYIVCFWLVGLALALNVPDEQWNRLLVLVDNEGEDILLDRVIASRSPGRSVGRQLCFKKPYARLLAAVEAPPEQQPLKLREFVDHWYEEMGTIGRSGRAKQAVPYAYPYWYKLGNENFEGGAYFGRWCIEAVVVSKALGIDDGLCLGHQNYPGDLLRPGEPTTHPIRLEARGGFFRRLFSR